MKTVSEVMTALAKKGSAQTRKTFARHGAPPEMFGVKVADLKVIAKIEKMGRVGKKRKTAKC